MLVVPWTRGVVIERDKWLDLGYSLKVEPTRVPDGSNYMGGDQG